MDGKTMAKEFLEMPAIEVARMLADLESVGVYLSFTGPNKPKEQPKQCRLYLDIMGKLKGNKVKAIKVLMEMLKITLLEAKRMYDESDGRKVFIGNYDSREQAMENAERLVNNLIYFCDRSEESEHAAFGYNNPSHFREVADPTIFLFKQ